jgi:uncharacterized membrane protein
MSTESPLERARENAVEIVSVLVTAIWMGALFTGQEWWLAALLVGYVAVIPVTQMLFGDEDEDEADADVSEGRESSMDTDQQDALQTLRDRYARGELTDEQFERKVERLLETETLEDVEDRARERSLDPVSDDHSGDDGVSDREREPEFS